jgi:hypothetical protein
LRDFSEGSPEAIVGGLKAVRKSLRVRRGTDSAGAPEVFMKSRSASLASGNVAKDSPDDQMPRSAWTLLTSISFFTARTAACGCVCVSSVETSNLRPAAPPAALTASTPA